MLAKATDTRFCENAITQNSIATYFQQGLGRRLSGDLVDLRWTPAETTRPPRTARRAPGLLARESPRRPTPALGYMACTAVVPGSSPEMASMLLQTNGVMLAGHLRTVACRHTAYDNRCSGPPRTCLSELFSTARFAGTSATTRRRLYAAATSGMSSSVVVVVTKHVVKTTLGMISLR